MQPYSKLKICLFKVNFPLFKDLPLSSYYIFWMFFPSVLSSRVPWWQKCIWLELRGGGARRTSPACASTAGQRRPHLRAGWGGSEPHPASGGGQGPWGGGHLCGRSFPKGQVLPHGLHAALHVQPRKYLVLCNLECSKVNFKCDDCILTFVYWGLTKRSTTNFVIRLPVSYILLIFCNFIVSKKFNLVRVIGFGVFPTFN